MTFTALSLADPRLFLTISFCLAISRSTSILPSASESASPPVLPSRLSAPLMTACRRLDVRPRTRRTGSSMTGFGIASGRRISAHRSWLPDPPVI